MPRILIAASGTGGHLFPALAVAERLPPNWKINWIGVPDRLEASLVPRKYNLFTIQVGGMQGSGIYKFVQLFRLILATSKVFKLLKVEKPQVVFTTGGYIAAPVILAASCAGIPVLLHESNAFPGKVTRFLGRLCRQIAVGMPPAVEYLKMSRVVYTGTPVRSSFLIPQLLPDWVPSGVGPLIVFMGGSQGALGLNRMARAVIPSLVGQGCRIVLLTGAMDSEISTFNHQNFVQRTFCEDMAGLLQHADLAISRAGAGAISELAITGTPAILVPYPYAADNHQEVNAAFVSENAAAVIVHQHNPNPKALSNALARLLSGRLSQESSISDPLIDMGSRMENLAVPNSSKNLIDIMHQFL